jgi:hypothetical protein
MYSTVWIVGLIISKFLFVFLPVHIGLVLVYETLVFLLCVCYVVFPPARLTNKSSCESYSCWLCFLVRNRYGLHVACSGIHGCFGKS